VHGGAEKKGWGDHGWVEQDVVSLKTAKRRHSIGTATVQPNFSVAALAAAAGSGRSE